MKWISVHNYLFFKICFIDRQRMLSIGDRAFIDIDSVNIRVGWLHQGVIQANKYSIIDKKWKLTPL